MFPFANPMSIKFSNKSKSYQNNLQKIKHFSSFTGKFIYMFATDIPDLQNINWPKTWIMLDYYMYDLFACFFLLRKKILFGSTLNENHWMNELFCW